MEKNPIITLSNVTISHQDGPLLAGVNLTLGEGEFLYLIGKSGAGKTSLLRTLYADKEIESGLALVCGHDVTSIRKRQVPQLRRRVGIVFQNARLLPDRNVYDNLYFVLRATGWKKKSDIDARIMETLASVGMEGKAASMPYRLSEGEQQRVALARALVNNPLLLLADEPTGNLDPITSSEIMSLLTQINQEKKVSMIISTHDFMMIDKYPARVACCEDGTLHVSEN